MNSMTLTLAAGLVSLTAAACVSTPATAGQWRFDPARCPDLAEDRRDRIESRRDERIDHGPLDRIEDRADRRESRRDERVTVCPRSAWVWAGAGARPAYPARAVVYFDRVDGVYVRKTAAGRVRVRVY
ncbi:MAG: hypothetical protein AAFY22_15145 [Pseudomonadota bacterium]